MKNTKRFINTKKLREAQKAKESFFLFRKAGDILLVAIAVAISIRIIYSYFGGNGENLVIPTFLILGVLTLNFFVSELFRKALDTDSGNDDDDDGIPNKKNFFAPRYLSPSDIYSSLVDGEDDSSIFKDY